MRGLLQFTLDLFDGASGRSPAAPVTPQKQLRPQPVSPASTPTVLPLQPINVQEPVVFTHPHATREVRLKGTRVAYEFVRGRRRTIGFMVGPQGLSVRAPRGVTLKDIDAALVDKADWILRKLDETRDRHDRIEAARVVWKDGAQFAYLGQPVLLLLDPRDVKPGVTAELETVTREHGPASHTLRLTLAQDASEGQIRNAVLAWITTQAKRLFVERLDHFAPQLDVRWSKLSLSNAATRWGSASADGSIRLNWRLVHFDLPVIDYVVAHELSHLRVMNHSQLFWDTVATVVPNYPALRRRLKDEPVPRW